MNKHYFLVFPFPWIFLVVFMLHTETQGNPNAFETGKTTTNQRFRITKMWPAMGCDWYRITSGGKHVWMTHGTHPWLFPRPIRRRVGGFFTSEVLGSDMMWYPGSFHEAVRHGIDSLTLDGLGAETNSKVNIWRGLVLTTTIVAGFILC